ncbi:MULTISPECIES: hypothetical protein [unclassified Gilliamella]|uniref:hypothetical protein n=1 Tax=unclassified Gilliamella TaxID=2685620 RepID=UPI001307F81C|nr:MULTISPECIES: hypothetical protein [unclassified Gilliamella]MWP48670.1 hypothetical protein [Gilliamella sp. Lep-s35]MWP69879.1 hypothetical protein [Gilliamella sp. Lep-s5]MWP76941.1 hypothetical protein [Gilliamella sp. Lep-s21]
MSNKLKTSKHTKTIDDLEKAMLNTDKAKKAYEDAQYEWHLKELLAKARSTGALD